MNRTGPRGEYPLDLTFLQNRPRLIIPLVNGGRREDLDRKGETPRAASEAGGEKLTMAERLLKEGVSPDSLSNYTTTRHIASARVQEDSELTSVPSFGA